MSPVHGVTAPLKPHTRRCQQRRLRFFFCRLSQYSILMARSSRVGRSSADMPQAAGHRRTKLSGPEAQVWLGDHDPPTPMDKAERSARVLSEQTRDRDFPQHSAALGHADTLTKE